MAIEDEGVFVGRAEAGGAGHGTDDHRTRFVEQPVDTVLALFCVGEGADAGGAARRRARSLHLFKGECGAGAEHQKVVVQVLAIGEADLLFEGLQPGQGGVDEADPLLLHMRLYGEGDILALSPPDRNPRVRRVEFKVGFVVHQDDVVLLAEFGLELVGGRHAPQPCPDDDDGCHNEPPLYYTAPVSQYVRLPI